MLEIYFYWLLSEIYSLTEVATPQVPQSFNAPSALGKRMPPVYDPPHPSHNLEPLQPGRTLHFILKATPFDHMITGEKPYEFRRKSVWMKSRLFHRDGTRKEFKYVTFRRGYAKNSPIFTAIFLGLETVHSIDHTFSSGYNIHWPYSADGYFKIRFGRIVAQSNLPWAMQFSMSNSTHTHTLHELAFFISFRLFRDTPVPYEG